MKTINFWSIEVEKYKDQTIPNLEMAHHDPEVRNSESGNIRNFHNFKWIVDFPNIYSSSCLLKGRFHIGNC